MKAKVAYTYGWTDEVINRMPYKTFLQYWIAITPIEAEMLLGQMNAAAYPHMKRPAAKKFFQQVKRQTTQLINKSQGKVKSYKDVIENLKNKVAQSGR